MIVCMCEGLSDRDIQAELDQGVDSVGELRKRCGASGQCGMCANMIRRMVAARQERNGGAPPAR
jgi:bacterioferritin-associated ferredoxin